MSDKIKSYIIWVFLSIIVVLFVILIYKDREINKLMLKETDSTDIKIIEIKNLLKVQLRNKDSLIFLLSAKEQQVNVTKIYYEQKNKEVANLSSTATDSLFNKNLQSDYARFSYLFAY